jgi:diguanylate cyclase (GGDEF)-like protein
LFSIKPNLFFSLLIFSSIFFYCHSDVYAQQAIEKEEFNKVMAEVKRLLKIDTEGALNQLNTLSNKIVWLSVEQKLKYYQLLSEVYISKNKFISAKETTGKALHLAKTLSGPSIITIELLYARAFSFESLGDLKSAADNYKKGLELAKSVNNKVLIAEGLIDLGAIAYQNMDFERSLRLLNEGYKIAIQADDEEVKGKAYSELALVYSQVGEIQQSITFNLQSYKHFKKVGLLLNAQNSLANLGMDYVSDKQYKKAITTFNTIISESGEDSSSLVMYEAYSGLAWAYLRKEENDPKLAYQYFLKAVTYLQGSQRYDNQLRAYVDKAFFLFKLKRYEEVLTNIKAAEQLLTEHESLKKQKSYEYLDIYSIKSKALYELKRFKEAYEIEFLLPVIHDELNKNVDKPSVSETRLSLESEKADLKNTSLKNENTVHEANLVKAKKVNKEQNFYLLTSAIIALLLAWLVIKLVYSQRQLKIASTIDSLTGIANRRSLMTKALLVFNFAKSKNLSLSLLIIDIDNFKEVNDTLGHSHGDVVLKETVKLTSSLMRKNDVFGRWGGEEFMVFLPGENLQAAIKMAERIRLRIAEKKWLLSEVKQVTVSIGVTSFDNDHDLNSFIQRTDKLLYQAKVAGRNKVCS